MKLWISLCRANLYRGFCSARFPICVAGVTLALLFAVSGTLSMEGDVLYYLELSIAGSGMADLVLCVLPLFPYAASYAEDAQDGAILYWTVRAGTGPYIISKYLVAILCGFCVTCFGMILFVLCLLPSHPFFSHSTTGNAFSSLLEQGRPVAYLVYFILYFSLSSGLLSAVAFWVSTVITDKFAVMAAPVVGFFLWLRICAAVEIPEFLTATFLVDGVVDMGSPTRTLVMKLVVVVCLCGLLGVNTRWLVERRLL